MPIEPDTPSLAVTQVMLAGLGELLRPNKVYVLGPQEVHDGKLPTENDYVGWKYLTPLSPDIGLATLLNQGPGADAVFAGISYGRQAAQALQILPQLETLPGIAAWTYELRMLNVPALLTEAFWLKAAPPGTDYVVAYDSKAPNLQVRYAYTMAQFLEILKPLAASRLQFVAAQERAEKSE